MLLLVVFTPIDAGRCGKFPPAHPLDTRPNLKMLPLPRIMAVHANWQDRSLFLWGQPTADARGLADGAALRDYVGQLSSDGLLASVAQDATLPLWLPADDQGPITSCAEPTATTTLAR